MAQQQQAPVGSRRGRDGSRWYNARPAAKDVAKWFNESVPLDEGMDHTRYVGGITLIEGWERSEEMRQGQNGNVFPTKVRNLAFTPYMKVDTRSLYFKDWCLARKYVGEITPAVQHPEQRPGFFARQVGGIEYVGCSFQVRVWERYDLVWRDGRIAEGKPVLLAAPASKLVPVLAKTYNRDAHKWELAPDEYADMKAETGALGRALGMAGMLIVPGSGVATAEDIQEMIAREATGGVLTPEDHSAAPSLPPADPTPEPLAGEPTDPDPDETLRSEVTAKLSALKDLSDQAHDRFQHWAREERGFKSIADISGPQLRGVARKLDKTIETVEAAQKHERE